MEDYSLDENPPMFLTLVSNDNQTFEIEEKYCNISLYIQNIISLDSQKKTINIDTTGNLLSIIVNFLNHYQEEPFDRIQKPVPKDFQKCKFILDNQDDTFDCPFYTEMLKDTTIDYMKLVFITNYLAISPLLELICARIANIVRDMTKEEEIKFLQISNTDYDEMKKTNDWAKN